ncbi:uncharacterized protein LOC116264886 [Nymphaea colorata]|nr:uncharacterized protein LOC116264886 [Nymphaea colorata]
MDSSSSQPSSPSTSAPPPTSASPLQRPEGPLSPPLHQTDADEDDENVKQLKQCASLYLALQDCLVNSNRDWRSCQSEVQALKACHEKQMDKGKSK